MAHRRWWTGVVVACTLLAGCQWVPSVRYDAGNSGHNAVDRTLTAASINAMQVRFRASLGSFADPNAPYAQLTPVYVNDHVIVPARGKLLWFDARGIDQCGGTPNVCSPQWTGDLGAPWVSLYGADVVGDVVYVNAGDRTSLAKLFAFDLRGTRGCSGGTPIVCHPLWTADVLTDDAPTVVGGKVYVYDMHRYLSVFDAAGVEGCAGTPTVCEPLWTAPTPMVVVPPQRVAVVNGLVYVADRRGQLTVTDAHGVQGCSGTPKVCQPLWTTPSTVSTAVPSPVVSGGKAFVLRASTTSFDWELVAFDAAGVAGCGGVPKVCQPLWSTPRGNVPAFTNLAVANQKVYMPDGNGAHIKVFDADGSGCSGVPMTCAPLFTFGSTQPVTIANGLALQSTPSGFKAYDANGVTNCVSNVCSPVAQVYLGAPFNGFITGDGKVFGVSIDLNGVGTLTGAW